MPTFLCFSRTGCTPVCGARLCLSSRPSSLSPSCHQSHVALLAAPVTIPPPPRQGTGLGRVTVAPWTMAESQTWLPRAPGVLGEDVQLRSAQVLSLGVGGGRQRWQEVAFGGHGGHVCTHSLALSIPETCSWALWG